MQQSSIWYGNDLELYIAVKLLYRTMNKGKLAIITVALVFVLAIGVITTIEGQHLASAIGQSQSSDQNSQKTRQHNTQNYVTNTQSNARDDD